MDYVALLAKHHGNKTAAARELGIPRTTFNDRLNKACIEPRDLEPGLKVEEEGETATIWAISDSVLTVQDAIDKAGYDMKLWRVVRSKANSWPTSMKIKTAGGEEPHQVWNWQVTVWLERRAPKHVQDGLKLLLDAWKAPKLPPVKRRRLSQDKHLVEMSLYDAHFGKRCWQAETGEASYDLDIAESVWRHAVEDLLDRIADLKVERIVLPLGHDFFQCNNWRGETAKGTRVDSVDDRMPRVFKVGVKACADAILRAREFAPVEVLWVPGNHDPETSFYLVQTLQAMFQGDKHVTFDDSPQHRKYRLYGVSLIGYAHGNEERHEDYPLIMATSVPDLWARATYRAMRCGHFHKRKERSFTVGDTHNGVRVEIMPSLSGTDQWHYDRGYVNNVRSAEAHLWHITEGPAGFLPFIVRE